jgi:hypothetical protein
MDVVNEHNEKQDMADYVTQLVQSGGSPKNKDDNTEGTNIVFWVICFVLLAVIGYILIQLKWIPL